ncbi:hypothetical protein [Oceanidesulfovibrio marinus]|uniref:Uncharacterized protein n=1 Tax=Oceanidesulfovibrio marinus TaxID=370038 RepID=A0A6P1ZKV9_9BACT|nr:hypothetical protein [Oceanidesulfovibrio marinus]TVM36581.1 hypothetical protein DQK91_01250 [Oceanidesulfovibrio marinus]
MTDYETRHAKLMKLHKLLTERLLEAMQGDEENPSNAAVLRVAVAFLKDNGITRDSSVPMKDAEDMLEKMLDDLPDFSTPEDEGTGRNDQ